MEHGRCLVTSCTREGNQIITVVLGCDSKKQRTTDSIKLIENAFENYTRVNVEEIVKKEYENWKQMNTKRIYINKAEKQEAELELAEMKRKVIPIQKGEEKEISIEINAIYQYEAPVIEGTKIGNIIVKRKEEIVETIDITLAKTIEKKSSLNYLIQLITTLPNYQLIK